MRSEAMFFIQWIWFNSAFIVLLTFGGRLLSQLDCRRVRALVIIEGIAGFKTLLAL